MNEYGASGQGTGLAAGAKQFLIFSLGSEEYGVDILNVREIKGNAPITRIPNSPPDVAGVLNLRGTIVPVIDLRRKFGLESVVYDQFSAIIVVAVQNRVMGMIVDSVTEVINIPDSDIQPPSGFATSVEAAMLQGLAKVGDGLVILLNVEAALLEPTELAAAA